MVTLSIGLAMTAGNIITLAVALVTIVSAGIGLYVALNNKITKLEASTSVNKEEIASVEVRLNMKISDSENRFNASLNRIDNRFSETDKKLDGISRNVNDLPFKLKELMKGN